VIGILNDSLQRPRRTGTSGQGPKAKSRVELEKDAQRPNNIQAESTRLRIKFAKMYSTEEEVQYVSDSDDGLNAEGVQRESKRLRLQ